MPKPRPTPRRPINARAARATDAESYEGDFSHPTHGTREHNEVEGKEDGVNREFEAAEGDFSHPAHGTADPDAA